MVVTVRLAAILTLLRGRRAALKARIPGFRQARTPCSPPATPVQSLEACDRTDQGQPVVIGPRWVGAASGGTLAAGKRDAVLVLHWPPFARRKGMEFTDENTQVSVRRKECQKSVHTIPHRGHDSQMRRRRRLPRGTACPPRPVKLPLPDAPAHWLSTRWPYATAVRVMNCTSRCSSAATWLPRTREPPLSATDRPSAVASADICRRTNESRRVW